MQRRNFLKNTALAVSSAPFVSLSGESKERPYTRLDSTDLKKSPLAITMWDISWLERRWPGAGYESWDQILRELVERGYDAVRIDAYPHLIAEDPEREWTLIPVWTVHPWGSPALTKVRVQPSLNDFLRKCREHKIKVGLSSWYRQDSDNVRMKIKTPAIMAEQWVKTIRSIEKEGLLDTIIYVDLCNEWPGSLWAPYFKNEPPELTWGGWYTDKSVNWMKTATQLVQKEYSKLPVGFSIEPKNPDDLLQYDVSYMDYLEPHVWMAQVNKDEFYRKMDFRGSDFNETGYEITRDKAEKLYRSDKDYWDGILTRHIRNLAGKSSKLKLPLMTTECWAIVFYKDWPLMDWAWVKELCEVGVRAAAATGHWLAIGTSNFTGPQHVGMWRDIGWHRRMTSVIKAASINPEMLQNKLSNRIYR